MRLALLILLPGLAVAQEGDPVRGEVVFQRCYACHAVDPAERGLSGPLLRGVVGRPAASIEGFEYSDAMRRSGIVWHAPEIDRFIADPQTSMPGTAMHYVGLRAARDRSDVIAYLREQPR